MSQTTRLALAFLLLVLASLQATIYFVVNGYISNIVSYLPPLYQTDSSNYRTTRAWLVVALSLFITFTIIGLFLIFLSFRHNSSEELSALSELLQS